MCISYLPALINTSVRLAAFDSGPSPAENYNDAAAFVFALTGSDANTAIIDVRLIHDQRKDLPAIPRRGRLCDLWNDIIAWQAKGYGCFVCINSMDGSGRYEIANVQTIRCQAIDLDNLSAQQNYERATQFNPPPSFAVQSSRGRWHVYWQTQQHNDHDRFTLIQRKLIQHFDSDKTIIDPSRVLRLPGTLHQKQPSNPHLITCWALAGYGNAIDPAILEIALANINVIDGSDGRHELGEPSLQAPSRQWADYALMLFDPNEMARADWISFMAAWKQSAWSHYKNKDELRNTFMRWCERYRTNDIGENQKQWASIKTTEVGWQSLARRNAHLAGTLIFGDKQTTVPHQQQPQQQPTGEFLTDNEQREWFKGCILIGPENHIIDGKGLQYDVGAFNSTYGGKRFIIDRQGKTTDEPWKAATRSTLWTVPKVDGTTFRPDLATSTITTDELGRRSVNVYNPATIERMEGDASPFLKHLAALIPNPDDQRILLTFMAHNAKYPGFKIPWAPVIQSTEGAGKNVIKHAMTHVMGNHYTYPPNPKELASGGGKFNDWMNRKLFLIADEIKTDKRDLVEVLKPMISETTLEMQGKGRDQRKADNPANWMFFTNWKDAIPVHANGRRFAIFYSAIQSLQDALDRGMDDAYFKTLYDDWLGEKTHKTGLKIIADYLLRYPIERGAIPMRAPHTSATEDAITESRGWLETLIVEAVEDQRNGFRAGWINTAAVGTLLRNERKDVQPRTIGEAIKALKYHRIRQAGRGYFQDDPSNPNRRGWLWNKDRLAMIENYGRNQGYE